jgi:hypothetical protein
VLYEAAFAVVVPWFQDARSGTAMLAITIGYTPVMVICAAGGPLGAAGLHARPARSATRTPVA